jgi:hypothetical protein
METKRANLSFTEAYTSFPSFRQAVDQFRTLSALLRRYPELSSILVGTSYNKNAHQFMEYQRAERMVLRPFEGDRVFPLETVALQQYNREHEAAIEHAAVHTGPLADEFARSLNALAVTVGEDIYFRNNAYNPTDEEGRKLLAHELTHVAQHDEGRVNKNNPREQLEAEAVIEEAKEGHETDPVVTVDAQGRRFTVRASRMKQITREVSQDIEEWIKQQKDYLDEERYLELLVSYRDWLREVI